MLKARLVLATARTQFMRCCAAVVVTLSEMILIVSLSGFSVMRVRKIVDTAISAHFETVAIGSPRTLFD